MLLLTGNYVFAQTGFPQQKRTGLWLKSSDVEYDTAGGNVVTYWGDGSAKGTNSMDSVFGAVKYVRKGLNMHPTVTYDVTGQYLQSKGFQFGSPKSGEMFIVMQNKAGSNLATTGQKFP